MAKKQVEVVATGGTPKYNGTYRVPGTESARFKCDLAVAEQLIAAGVVVPAAAFDAGANEAAAVPSALTVEILDADFSDLVGQIEDRAREGYISQADHEAALEKAKSPE